MSPKAPLHSPCERPYGGIKDAYHNGGAHEA